MRRHDLWHLVWVALLSGCAMSGLEVVDDGAGDGSGDGDGASEDDEGPQPGDGDGDGDGDADDGDFEGCAHDTRESKPSPVDLFILLDQSGSMTEGQDRWTPVTDALGDFIRDPAFADLGVGLEYFPRDATFDRDPIICQPQTYATPEVPLAALGDNAAQLEASLAAHYFTQADAHAFVHRGTPTRAAVDGVLTYLRGWVAEHPDRRTYLLLATDGEPSGSCDDNDIPMVAAALTAAAAATPPVPTYVIGIGEIANLAQLATAGGTGHGAFVVDDGQTEAQFRAALEAIRTLSVPCDYPIPAIEEDGVSIDYGRVNVRVGQPGAEPSTVPQTRDRSACRDDQPAWHYDDPDAPTKVVLCPAACESVRHESAKLEIVYGCATTVL
jgi:hypothetical protein